MKALKGTKHWIIIRIHVIMKALETSSDKKIEIETFPWHNLWILILKCKSIEMTKLCCKISLSKVFMCVWNVEWRKQFMMVLGLLL